ncbi:MAG: hypothetical protein AB4352_22885 [Hormoscilla sp.]
MPKQDIRHRLNPLLHNSSGDYVLVIRITRTSLTLDADVTLDANA